MTDETLILGGGLTGLSSAHVLSRHGAPVRVFEGAPHLGGASRTVEWEGFRFDLGGHRFYTRNEEVLGLVRDLLGDELLTVPRLSRIYLRGHLVDYPLSFFNALRALGPATSAAVAASYVKEKLRNLVRRPPDETFEDWVVSRFGRRLYEIYFKTYSEKVWGVPCSRLEADFAAQRIRGLSFRKAVRNMLTRRSGEADSLVSQFYYPRRGFGQIPQKMAESLPEGSVHLSSPVVGVRHDGSRVLEVATRESGEVRWWGAAEVISTIPIDELVRMLEPAPPAEVLGAAKELKYRDLIVLFLVLDREQVSPDQWMYFPDPDVFFGRMHEPKNWSPQMAPADRTGLAIEVFCFQDQPVWEEPVEQLLRRAAQELEDLGLIRASEAAGGTAVRYPNAYPLYEAGYRENMALITSYLRRLENLQLAGRNALFRYTSGDRYIEMGLKAARNILEEEHHDVSAVAAEQDYAED